MVRTTRLGGTASHIEVANVAHGLMRMTWVPKPVSDEQAFKSIKDGIDAAVGAKVYLNSGEYYGVNPPEANLHLLARFFDAHPGYAEKTILCVKGGAGPNGSLAPIATEENLRRSIDTINAALRGTHRLDVFENGRVDPAHPIEETAAILARLIHEGKFDHIGMSECSAETLRRANAVHPVASVEIEVSPFAYEEETQKVIATAAELKIPVLAYSPQAGGFLTGSIRSPADLDPNDMRRHYDRFQPENFHHNITLVDRLTEIAKRRSVTPGQLSIAWVLSLGPHMIPLPGSSHASRTLENLAAGDIVLTREERAEIDGVLKEIGVKGVRYVKGVPLLWG